MKFIVGALVFLLVASFALWGIGDIFRSGGGNEAAKVGSRDVSMDEYQRSLSVQTRRLEMQLGQRATDEMLAYYNIPALTLATLINQLLMKMETEHLGVHVDDERVAQTVRRDERFANTSGTFDRSAFDRYLGVYGYTETTFVEEVRADLERNLLSAALAAQTPITQTHVAALYDHREEKRTASVLRLSASKVGSIAAPKDDELAAYYEQEKDAFAAPEVRNISYVTLNTDNIAHEMDLSDEALRVEYKFREDEFAPQDIRTLVQLLVPDEAKAKEIQAMVSNKRSLKISAKEAGEEVSEIGSLTREELADSGLIPSSAVDEVFSLTKGLAAKPFKSALGWHVIAVTDIEKGKAVSFEEAKPRLRTQILEDKGADLLYEITTQLEDKLAGGTTMEEAAKELGLTFNAVEALDGAATSGGAKVSLPEFGNFISVAFSTEEGETSSLVANDTNTAYFLLRVDSVTPPRIKALDEVRADVVDAWKAAQRKRALQERTIEVSKALLAGETTMEQEATKLGVKLEKLGPLRRDFKDEDTLQPKALEELFTLAKGSAGNAWAQGEDYIILRADSIIPPAKEDRLLASAALAGELKGAFAQDIEEQLIIYLRTEHPVKQYINVE